MYFFVFLLKSVGKASFALSDYLSLTTLSVSTYIHYLNVSLQLFSEFEFI